MEITPPSLKPSFSFHLKSLVRACTRSLRLQRKWQLFSYSTRSHNLRPRSSSHRVRPIVLRSDDGTRLSGWLMTPKWPEAKGAVLYFGNGSEEALWLAGHAQAMFPEMTVLAMHYRSSGSAARPAVEQMVADGEVLYDWLADSHQHLADFPIVVMGRDFGAGVAVKVAASRPAAALTLLTPRDAVDLERSSGLGLWKRKPKTEAQAVFILKQASAVMVLRAQDDDIVPAAVTDAFVSRLPARTRDQTISRADHYDLPYREEVHAAIADFLREHVPAKRDGLQSAATVVQAPAEPAMVLAA